MSLRQDTSTTAQHKLEPDFMKSDATKVKEGVEDTVDNVASRLPGQSKARDAVVDGAANPHHDGHDAGRAGWGTTGDAMKPSGEQTIGEKISSAANNTAAFVQPNQSKSTSQNAKDTFTPGADSTLTPKTHDNANTGGGVMGSIGQAVVDAKEAVKGALGGDSNTHTKEGRTDL